MTMVSPTIPTLDELNAMRQRTQIRLTQEGAQSWYVNDVTALLDEVARLRIEINKAREWLIADLPDEEERQVTEHTPLYAVVDRWKATATGLYEKAQYKKLKADAHLAREELHDVSSKLEEAIETTGLEKARAEELALQVEVQAQNMDTLRELHRADMETRDGVEVELRDEIIRLNGALVDCNERCETVLAMQKAQYDELLERTMEYVDHAAQVLKAGVST